MRLVNILDEQNRFVGFWAEPGTGPQVNTHTYSYLECRRQYAEMGETQGFDLPQSVFYSSKILQHVDFRRYTPDV